MRILAIETSCDETGVAIVDGTKTESGYTFEVISNALLSQAALHAEYGGVYPNLAKREHQKNLPIMLREALEKAYKNSAQNNSSDLLEDSAKTFFAAEFPAALHDIDAIAVTSGPGLEPALWTGITFAEQLAAAWQKPLIAMNHMEGHLISSLIQNGELKNVDLPVLALLISGGHTEFILMKDWFEYEMIGHTLDDAVGEAFDKVARMLSLPYPGGPQISARAEVSRHTKEESKSTPGKQAAVHESSSPKEQEGQLLPKIKLPRPMITDDTCNMSFSGLKTAVLYALRDRGGIQKLSLEQIDACAEEFEDAVTDVLINKTKKALERTGARTMVIGGGVAANTHLRQAIGDFIKKDFFEVEFRLPEKSITGDNAIMIAEAALARALSGAATPAVEPIIARGNLSLSPAN